MEERLKKLESLRDAGMNPYPYTFLRTHIFVQIKKDFEALSQSETVIATCGRILTIRGHGKTIFATLCDESDKLQVYLRHDVLSEQIDLFRYFDIGDIIGVKGKVFKTKTGEITILVEEFTMLCKALRPLPEKWHGLKDIETRYRKRYLDLITNPVQRELFKKRTTLIALMRKFLDERNFIEVETPILQPIYGGAAARPFTTYYNALDQDMFLRIADELYLKRLITGGYEKVYEVCKDFRNEGIDRLHNPEFTMIELYQAYTDYEGMMALTETLIEYLVTNVNSSKTLKFNNKEITFKRPFRRIKYVDSLNHKVGFDVLAATDKQLSTVCDSFGIEHTKLTTGAKVDKLFNELVRKELVEPTFAIDHPKIISPLAKVHRSNDQLVERFQFFMFGLEIANAFSELNDPIEQRRRFEKQLAQKEEGIGEIDDDFIEALEYGMPPTGGLGIGIDRLCMALFNQSSLRDVILFPQLRKE
jgi:lysyl-tRNA synthetase class 2